MSVINCSNYLNIDVILLISKFTKRREFVQILLTCKYLSTKLYDKYLLEQKLKLKD